MPHALAYNAPAIGEALARINAAMATQDAAGALYDIAKNAGATMALKDLGMPEAGIEKAAQIALKNPYYNPRPLEETSIRTLIEAAWHGSRPTC